MAVIEPKKGKHEKPVPPVGVLLVNPVEAKTQMERAVAAGARRRFLFNSGLVVDERADFFLAGPAVGAPVAVMTLEKLTALGARRVLLCGWCGAISPRLRIGDVLVPTRADIGEGTSQYYRRNHEENSEESAPHQGFSEETATRLAAANITVRGGCVRSTDGIYREERETLLALHRDYGVDAIDMEFSALCSAAAFRGTEFAAVLVVSDITCGEKWQPGHKTEIFRKSTERVLSLCCSKEFLHSDD